MEPAPERTAMNPKSTGILFVLAAAMAAFVYLYEIEGEQGRKDAEEATKRLFPGVEQESIEAITLHSTDGSRVEVARVDDRWRITTPLEFPADDFAIDGIARNAMINPRDRYRRDGLFFMGRLHGVGCTYEVESRSSIGPEAVPE